MILATCIQFNLDLTYFLFSYLVVKHLFSCLLISFTYYAPYPDYLQKAMQDNPAFVHDETDGVPYTTLPTSELLLQAGGRGW